MFLIFYIFFLLIFINIIFAWTTFTKGAVTIKPTEEERVISFRTGLSGSSTNLLEKCSDKYEKSMLDEVDYVLYTRDREPPSPYLPQMLCERSRVVVKKINPYLKQNEEPEEPRSPLASACIRCGTCLAIAHHLDIVLDNLQEKASRHESYGLKTMLEKSLVTSVLRESCDQFHNYGLREYKGYRLIAEALPMTSHVPCRLDGSWGVELRHLCFFYLREFGEWPLYIYWRRDNDLANALCRGEGVFRDCYNIDTHNKDVDIAKKSQDRCSLIRDIKAAITCRISRLPRQSLQFY